MSDLSSGVKLHDRMQLCSNLADAPTRVNEIAKIGSAGVDEPFNGSNEYE